MWIIPSELTDALKGIGSALGGTGQAGQAAEEEDAWVDTGEPLPTAFDDTVLEDPARALAEAREEAARSSAEAEGHSAGVSGRRRPGAGCRPTGPPPRRRSRTRGPAAVPTAPPAAPPALPLDGPVAERPRGAAR